MPNNLIALYPSNGRSNCRLMCVDSSSHTIKHQHFAQLIEQLNSGDVLVLNNTKVLPARLFGHKSSGGQIELLLERIIDHHHAWVQLRANKKTAIGSLLQFDGCLTARVKARQENLTLLYFEHRFNDLYQLFQQYGQIPLPPYIQRPAEPNDQARYQTVYAQHLGAVAAPTAGLHFDEDLLRAIADKGIHLAYVTLHIGAGTFQPIRADNITDHQMHFEHYEVPQLTAELVNYAHQQGNRVIAVGTTSVRCLESSCRADGQLQPQQGNTNIFIYPGYQWRCVDALITNFHLPESTLIMLVCAFAGFELVMQAYQNAIIEGYAFYSYGDAMFLTR